MVQRVLLVMMLHLVLHCVGCGGGNEVVSSAGAQGMPIDVLEVSAALDWPALPQSVSFQAEADIGALAVAAGRVMVGTEVGLFRLQTEGLEPFDPYPTAVGDPLSTGAIQALTSVDEEILVAASEGIFYGFGETLFRSPLSDVLQGATVHTIDVADDDGSVWVASSDGFLKVSDNALESISIEGVDGEPGHVVALDEVVLVS